MCAKPYEVRILVPASMRQVPSMILIRFQPHRSDCDCCSHVQLESRRRTLPSLPRASLGAGSASPMFPMSPSSIRRRNTASPAGGAVAVEVVERLNDPSFAEGFWYVLDCNGTAFLAGGFFDGFPSFFLRCQFTLHYFTSVQANNFRIGYRIAFK